MILAKAYDVVIVGAGPSGSTLARLLAREGLLTLLLDKEKFPRCKPCGGLVSVRALRELDFKVDKVTKVVYTGAKIFRPRGGYVDLKSDSPFVIGISRADFDSYLVMKQLPKV